MSSVFYRWGARRDESRITFDGTHISVFDLKREIILNNKMGNGKDFDIGVFDNVTGEEFKDDNHQIPRSSSLIARRLPSSIKGRGNAQDYIVGTTAADALKNDHRIESHAREALLRKEKEKALKTSGALYGSNTKRFDGKDEKDGPAVPISTGNADEDAKIQAMFAQNADNWEQMQEDMSLQSRGSGGNRGRGRPPGVGGPPRGGPGAGKFDYSMPTDKEPPTGYICYRCGQKGHWIQDCPNNDDPQAQEKKRYVRVTGIPRSFLKTVETPVGNEGSSAGAMLTADGGFVQAMPDKRQWQKVVGAKPRTMTPQEVRETQPSDPDLACPICKKVIWEAVKTPCCSTSYCEECVTNWLIDHEFVCESCESKVGSLEELVIDEELREKVGEYIEVEIVRSKREKEEEDEQAGITGGDQTEPDAEGSGEVKAEPEAGEEGASQDEKDKKSADSATPAEEPKVDSSILDPAKMQEMLNPQTMQLYLSQIAKMMQNPKISPQGKALLQTQLQMVQTAVMQTQAMLGQSQGMMNPMGMGMNDMMGMVMGMNGGMGMGMGMDMMGGMGGMNNGMGMGMGMNQMGMNQRGMGMGMNNGMGGMGMNNNMMGGNNMNMGPQQMGNMGMMNQNMGMIQNMGINQNMGMNQNMGGGMGQGQGHMGGGGFRGRGGMPFRGGGPFRGRGGMGGGGVGPRSGIPIPQVRPPKRAGEELERA